jgi:hypothetical protein
MPAEPGGRDRILIVGGVGTGKTTLARKIADASNVPVYHLDDVYRVGGGNGPIRPPAERSATVASIVLSPRWVAEGVHLGWTSPLMEAADAIVWLDHVSWRQASRRIVRRFVSGALAEARRQKGHRKFSRVGAYARHLRELLAAIPESRTYGDTKRSDYADGAPSRARTIESLGPYRHKVVHCRTAADVDRFIQPLKSTSQRRPDR